MTNLVQIGDRRRAADDGDGGRPRKQRSRKQRPEWLRIRIATPERYRKVKGLVDRLSLNTVCTEARCPNIYECWGEHGTATFMILGDTCTRRCGFCAVKSGRPPAPPDPDEPGHVAEAVETMNLQHAVITSVDRDDLPDGGARHWADVIRAVHERNPGCAVEVLTPDFRAVPDALDVVLGARPEIFSHNMETVPRLYRKARPGSRYQRSLELLEDASARRDRGEYVAGALSSDGDGTLRRGRVKTGIMLGLGEEVEEIRSTLRDIRSAGVEVMTLGQYLQPTSDHLPVDRFVTPEEFAEHKAYALELGFAHCESGPLVRSSYHAHEHVGNTLRSDAPSAAGETEAAAPALERAG